MKDQEYRRLVELHGRGDPGNKVPLVSGSCCKLVLALSRLEAKPNEEAEKEIIESLNDVLFNILAYAHAKDIPWTEIRDAYTKEEILEKYDLYGYS